jgi:hypothetical protein
MSEEKELVKLASENEIQERLAGLRGAVEQVEVKDEEGLKAVAEKIKIVKDAGKFFRAELEKYSKPAKEIIKTAQDRFLPLENECKDAEEVLKRKANDYLQSVEVERRRQEDIIAKKVEKGQLKETTAIKKLDELGEEKKTVKSEGATLQRRTVRVVKIIDSSLIPDEYWVVDEVKVKKCALAGLQIPGVIITEESQIAIK